METYLLDDQGEPDLGQLPERVLGPEHARPPSLEHLHRDLSAEDGDPTPPSLRTRLVGGRYVLRQLVCSEPCSDASLLARRQAALKALAGRAGADARLEDTLEQMAGLERDVLWMFRARSDDAMRAVIDAAYFGVWPLRLLNRRSPLALTALNAYRIAVSPVVGVLSPVIYCIVPYVVLCWRLGRAIALGDYVRMLAASAQERMSQMIRSRSYAAMLGKAASLLLSFFLWFNGTVGSFQLSSTLRSTCAAVERRSLRACQFMRMASGLRQCLWTPDLASEWFPAMRQAVAPQHDVWDPSPKQAASFATLGRGLHRAAVFDYELAADELAASYRLDALVAVVRSVMEGRMTWATFVKGQGPAISARGLVHPGLGERATPNDWDLGVVDKGDGVLARRRRKDVLLTGPNAGGKSTIMRALLSAVLCSQTLTIAPCSGGLSLTPFSLISSHIGVADRTGGESLFQAEMVRAAGALSGISGLAGKGLALVVIDEVFSSTNHVEGASAAAAVAKRLAECPHALSVVSTHFSSLPRLLRSTHTVHGMPVEIDADTGAVARYPYRLMPGLCRQYIALELMRSSNQFDPELVNDAIAVRKTLERPQRIQ